ncbi:von Willebrand factor A domain-containing protein 3B-like [Chanos chanos]|uniref:von Willebrand factor A domain-containing protein 3B-like n=1 Tax=Chanos chanos TaxID=29144 RepID=A0A6J2WN15_CHACN|nr:von Willebrand factor A domain-containing protein 3B [Chanos chanos]
MSGPIDTCSGKDWNQRTGMKQEVQALVSSHDWLREHGLKQSKLSFTQILMQISFRHNEDYVHSLGKLVSSQYAEGLFPQFMKDGVVYNLTASPSHLEELCVRLEHEAELLRHRLDWLTSGSRQLFGVVLERVVTLVLDFGERPSRAQFQLCLHSLVKLIQEQFSQIDQFNMIRSGRCVEMWRDRAAVVTDDNLRSAVDWLLPLQQEASSQTTTASAVLRAMEDARVEAVYLFAAGDFRDNIADLFRSRLVGNVCPVHTLSFNARRETTITALKALSELTAGSSEEWLQRFGLKAQKLTLHDALAECAFRHSDGVVNIKHTPKDERIQTDALNQRKLVNAKYCREFVHMQWKDGSVVHVNISAEKCRRYEERMRTALTAIQRRIDWWMSGSREVFGAVLEDHVYLVIDTSESMREVLPLVKDKVIQFIQEQLLQKTKVNIVSFGSRVSLWRDRLTEVTTQTMDSACRWVKELQSGGSANTLGALSQALADEDTQAVYLLTNGRPNQPSNVIEEQLKPLSPVPVHTISINCDDQEVNCFLSELSRFTGGHFHSYHTTPQEPSDIPDPSLTKPSESEDLRLLRLELEQGQKALRCFLRLHAECVMLGSSHCDDSGPRPHSAPPMQESPTYAYEVPRVRSATGRGPDLQGRGEIVQPRTRRCAAHTRASLLRLLSSSETSRAKALVADGNTSLQGWMLPETQELSQTNTEKQRHVLHNQSTVQWLKTNSLVARKLTIQDALAPTAIPQRGKYVPLLEKYVYSKVFDEILPLAHLKSSCSDSPEFTLINPLAVNLDQYKSRLQRAIQMYERRLNLTVWKALSQEERDKLGEGEPVMVLERRQHVLEALGRLGWPVTQEEITLLEDQIHIAQSYIQQATDLQKAAQELGKASHRNSASRQENRSHQTQKKTNRKPLDSLRGQRVVARSETNGYYYPGTVRRRLSRKRLLVDFSRGGSEVTPLGSVITVGGGCPCPPLAVGDFVLVGSGKDGTGERFVPGVVIATPRHLEVEDKLFSVLRFDKKEASSLTLES